MGSQCFDECINAALHLHGKLFIPGCIEHMDAGDLFKGFTLDGLREAHVHMLHAQAAQLFGIHLFGDDALADDSHAVGQRFHLAQDMRGEEDVLPAA